MTNIVAENYWRDQCRDNVRREGAEFRETHVYRATLRKMSNGVEVSVKDIEMARVRRARMPDVPLHLVCANERTQEEQEERDAENRRRAGRRAKQTVRWLLKSMQADHLLTLTYRENVDDIQTVQKNWQEFVRLMRKRYPDWQYVCVQERQERGAWHLHIGIRGRGDVYWIRRCWLMALGHQVNVTYTEDGKKALAIRVHADGQWRQALPSEVAGNVDLRGPAKRFGGKGSSWKTEKLAAYMTKYIAKTFDEKEKGRRYWPSKGITRPVKEVFWLKAVDWVNAVREMHDKVRNLYSCTRLHIWASDDLERLWLSGSDIECPF